MDGIVCDKCGAGLLIDANVRYELRVDLRAAYDPMELTLDDLKSSGSETWSSVLAQCESLTEEEAQRQVYFFGRFDLCPTCQREFLSDPLFSPSSSPPGESSTGDPTT